MINWFDTTNAGFEIGGSIAIWMDIFQILKDKRIDGLNVWARLFYTVWAIWSVYYYFYLAQWFSFWFAFPLAIGSLIWFGLMIKYRKNK